MKYIDMLTGKPVEIVREANTRKLADGSDACWVVKLTDGSTQIQFKSVIVSKVRGTK